MDIRWAAHLKGEDKENFIKYVRNSTTLLDRLTKIIEEKIKGLEAEKLDKKLYDSPNWALQQADITGSLRQLNDLLHFTKIER